MDVLIQVPRTKTNGAHIVGFEFVLVLDTLRELVESVGGTEIYSVPSGIAGGRDIGYDVPPETIDEFRYSVRTILDSFDVAKVQTHE